MSSHKRDKDLGNNNENVMKRMYGSSAVSGHQSLASPTSQTLPPTYNHSNSKHTKINTKQSAGGPGFFDFINGSYKHHPTYSNASSPKSHSPLSSFQEKGSYGPSGSSYNGNYLNQLSRHSSISGGRSKYYNSKGLRYSLRAQKEVSSIDKINDPLANTLVVAGKSHLGLYRFDPHHYGSIYLVRDVFQSSNNAQSNHGSFSFGKSSSLTSSSLNANKKKPSGMLSTICDVKAGFNNYSSYIATTSTSTAVSLYDVKRADTPLVGKLTEHTRSINSFDFHMGAQQNNMFITGGQDGTVKLWDLRKTGSSTRTNKSDISINTMSDSVRDVKWCPVWGGNDSQNQQGHGYRGNQDHTSNSSINEFGMSTHSSFSHSLSNISNIGNSNQSFDNKASTSSISSTASSNNGNYFASIHDSGNLLKYDLRNYSQPQKKINAHSGPGLCMHWHPNGEYIITGGRDGKLCLWFVGEGKPTFSPEQVMNVGQPVSKLKFQPTLKNSSSNAFIDSKFAMSPLGDDANVSIYSLANRYIPKNVLVTENSALGFVWYDENMVFSIDKGNIISGWDISKEADQLSNMSKNSLKWRDIEGDGLVFLSQKHSSSKSFEAPRSASTISHVTAPHTMKTSHTPNIIPKNKHRLSTSTVSGLLNSKSNSVANNLVGSNISTSPKQIMRSVPDIQHLARSPTPPSPQPHHLSKAALLKTFTQSTLKRAHSSFPNTQYSRPSTPIPFAQPMGIGSSTSPVLTAPHGHNPAFGSVSSSTSSAITNEETALWNEYQSPKVLTLDLPFIFNIIRTKNLNNFPTNAEEATKLSSTLKESPTEVFKFLARELKFSTQKEIDDKLQLQYLQEKKVQEQNGLKMLKSEGLEHTDEDGQEKEEDKDRKNLMKRLGISNTWSLADLEAKNEAKKLSTEKNTKATTKDNSSNEHTLESNENDYIDSLKIESNRKSSTNPVITFADMSNPDKNGNPTTKTHPHHNKHLAALKEKKAQQNLDNKKKRDLVMKNLMELITIADHNAETHLSIEDMASFKIWIMIRDSLLWKVKKLAARAEEGSSMLEKIDSYLTKNRKGYGFEFDEQINSNEQTAPRDRRNTNNIEGQGVSFGDESKMEEENFSRESSFSGSLNSHEGSFEYEYGQNMPSRKNSKSASDMGSSKSILEGIREKLNNASKSVEDEHALSDDYEEEGVGVDGKHFSSGTKPAQITQRRHSRTSFIDTMMNSLRSGKIDIDNEIQHRKNSMNPLLQRSPTFSIMPHSPQSVGSSLLTKEIKGLSEPTVGSSSAISENITCTNSVSVSEDKMNTFVEPWAPEILIKKIYSQAVDNGNVLLSMSILLLFQDHFSITTKDVVKIAVDEFMKILHKYELFEISAELLKYCPWGEEIAGEDEASTGQSAICLYCDKCHKLLVNEASKKKRLEENDKHIKFGYWYCDKCKKSNTLCALCERPIKKMAVGALECGHLGHPECFYQWFVKEQMEQCPKGCIAELLTT